MEKAIDLHIHSTYSEGVLNVKQILETAQKSQLAVLSLTDHNVIAGVAELLELAPRYGLTVLSGIELYIRYQQHRLHLLGYNFNPEDARLQKTVHTLQQENKKNILRSINALQKQGFIIEEESIFKRPSRNFGAVHILQEMERYPENVKKIEQELAPNRRGFFHKIKHYFGKDAPAYLPLSELPADQAIALIKNCGGFTSLAHPGQQLAFDFDYIILELQQLGLDAIEVLSPYHNWHQIEHYQSLALAHNLLITGGSDYHGDINFSQKELITRQWDYLKVPFSIYEQLQKNIKNLN